MSDTRCTTCHYFIIPYPQRYCAHPKHFKPIRFPFRPCADYIDMCDKGHVNRPVKLTFEQTREAIECR